MAKQHFKSNVVFSNPNLKINRDKGIIKGIQIAMHGKNKNGSYFNDEFLESLTNAGNEQKQGVKCRFGHPNMCTTSLGTFLGRYTNFSLKDRKVFADLKLDSIAKKTQVEGKGISMWEYVLDMAEGNPDMFGNSIVIASELFDEKVGKEVFQSHKLHAFIASDLVDDPAATDNLFDTSDLGVSVTNFLDENPQIFSAIQKDPSIIEDFFDRYANYVNNYKSKIDMSFLDKLKKKFSSKDTFDVEETTATGEIVTAITDDETPKVGDKVVDADGSPVADGELLLKDGTIWDIEGGLITEIKEPSEEDEDTEDEPGIAEVLNSVNALTNSFNAFKTQYKKDLKENRQATEFLADELETFNTKFTNLAKTVKSKNYDVPSAEPTTRRRSHSTESLAEQWRKKRETKND